MGNSKDYWAQFTICILGRIFVAAFFSVKSFYHRAIPMCCLPLAIISMF